MKWKDTCSLEGSYDQPRQHIKKQRYYFANKCLSSQSYGFSSSHLGVWELDYKESWVLKNRCFWTVALEKILEDPLDCKEIQPVHPKGSQSWILTGRSDAKDENPILWPPDGKNQLLGKDPDSGKGWRQEKGTIEDEMVGWHHQLDGHEFVLTLGVGGGQGGLACCRPWGRKQSDTTEQLNWTDWLLCMCFITVLVDVLNYVNSSKNIFNWEPSIILFIHHLNIIIMT